MSCDWHKRVRWLSICRQNRKIRQMYIERLQELKKAYEEHDWTMKEDPKLRCPEDVESDEGHYDPAGPGGGLGADGKPVCAGCGMPKSSHTEREICWLCDGEEPDTTIDVACETPGGEPCEPKDVKVHFTCYMDMDP